jgi:hypothetical protein
MYVHHPPRIMAAKRLTSSSVVHAVLGSKQDRHKIEMTTDSAPRDFASQNEAFGSGSSRMQRPGGGEFETGPSP